MARPPQDPQIRITEILDTAEPMFYANGYHETAISDIAKQMGVAQGTIYYYFTSKEELLETLINRQVSNILSTLKIMLHSQNTSPSHKIQTVLQKVIQSVYREEGLLFEFLYNEKNIHFIDRLARQGKKLLNPLLLEFIKEGNHQHYFTASHPQAVVNIMLALLDSLFEAIYDKVEKELLLKQYELTESIIESVLGVKKGSIHII